MKVYNENEQLTKSLKEEQEKNALLVKQIKAEQEHNKQLNEEILNTKNKLPKALKEKVNKEDDIRLRDTQETNIILEKEVTNIKAINAKLTKNNEELMKEVEELNLKLKATSSIATESTKLKETISQLQATNKSFIQLKESYKELETKNAILNEKVIHIEQLIAE